MQRTSAMADARAQQLQKELKGSKDKADELVSSSLRDALEKKQAEIVAANTRCKELEV